MHSGPYAGETIAVVASHGGSRGRVRGVCGRGLRPGGEERERETWQSGSPPWPATGALGRCSVRMRGEPEREREEGDNSVACCGRRGDLGGHEGEALGGRECLVVGGYSARAHCSALKSVQTAGMAIFLGQVGVAKYVWWLWGVVNKGGETLDALGGHWSEEGG